MATDLTLRPAVARFAQVMERELRENDHKGGWKQCRPADLFDLYGRLTEEVAELRTVLHRRANGDVMAPVTAEAADVANFAMIIADVASGLFFSTDVPPGPPEPPRPNRPREVA